ncbi:thioredoxin-disulfide reductase [bacterium]|nr:MAG: thioredoxin-disulfide reductase [bacterium]
MAGISISIGGTKTIEPKYDMAIIGAGPAGLTAGLYASRARVNHILFEKLTIPGGQVVNTEKVENYPGFPDGVGGFELMDYFRKQAEKFETNIVTAGVSKLTKIEDGFSIESESGNTSVKSVIIASGASPKKTGAENEEKFIGRGISFCATCDAALYKGKTVAVIGGGDAAVEEGMFLTRFAKKVYIIHRRDELRATKILQERAFANDKIEFVWSYVPKKILGDEFVEGIELLSRKDNSTKTIELDGIFEYIGIVPQTDFIHLDGLKFDERGFIITDAEMRTNIDGVFAAGDVRSKLLRQISTAVGDGATAEFSAEKFIENS